MLLRRRLNHNENGLYPVGTDIITKYIRNTGIGWLNDMQINSTTGELYETSGYSVTGDFIPIEPTYTYEKNNYRIRIGCYDANKTFISLINHNNTTTELLNDIPANTYYIKVSTVSNSISQVTITRK